MRDSQTGEPLVGVSVVEPSGKGTVTDAFGYYLLSVPKGELVLGFKSVGMKDITADVNIYSDGQLDVEMEEAVVALSEVVISDEKR